MSLLSATQGTPERVLSAVQLLAAHGGTMPRADLIAWLNPNFLRSDQERAAPATAAEQTLSAASSLGLMTQTGGTYALAEDGDLASLDALADRTHDHLIAAADDHADSVLMQAFAHVARQTDHAQGVGWLQLSNKVFADLIQTKLPPRRGADAEKLLFNETKVSHFWRWMMFVGLATNLPDINYPYVAERLARELRRSGLPRGQEIPVRDVLATIAQRMPYLDGGSHFTAAADRLELPAAGRALSPLLSTALRDLHEDSVLVLGVRRDAPNIVSLADDPFTTQSAVQFIVLNAEEGDD